MPVSVSMVIPQTSIMTERASAVADADDLGGTEQHERWCYVGARRVRGWPGAWNLAARPAGRETHHAAPTHRNGRNCCSGLGSGIRPGAIVRAPPLRDGR